MPALAPNQPGLWRRVRVSLAVVAVLGAALVWAVRDARYTRTPHGIAGGRTFAYAPSAVASLPPASGRTGIGAQPPDRLAPGRLAPGRLAPGRLAPDRLVVPSLGIAADVVPTATQSDLVAGRRYITLPLPEPRRVAISTDGAALQGRVGSVLIAGHVNLDGVPGALANLSKIRPGADIWVTDATARLTHWRVYADAVINKQSPSWPVDVFSPSGPRRLVLVTCTGALHYVPGYGYSYDDNLFVYAAPVP